MKTDAVWVEHRKGAMSSWPDTQSLNGQQALCLGQTMGAYRTDRATFPEGLKGLPSPDMEEDKSPGNRRTDLSKSREPIIPLGGTKPGKDAARPI